MPTRIVPISEILYSLNIANRVGAIRRDINKQKEILREQGQIVPLMVQYTSEGPARTRSGKYYLDRKENPDADALVMAAYELNWPTILIGWPDPWEEENPFLCTDPDHGHKTRRERQECKPKPGGDDFAEYHQDYVEVVGQPVEPRGDHSRCVKCNTPLGTKECPTYVDVVEFRFRDGEDDDIINERGPYCTYRCLMEDIQENLV